MENKKYFYGNEISEYGIQHNRVDYRTLAKSFDAVLCNDITSLFYHTIDGEYLEPEQINGFIDNSESINELEERIEKLENKLDYMDLLYNPDEQEQERIQKQIDDLQKQIDDLQLEQDSSPDIYQWYIISDGGKAILEYHTNEIVYHIPVLDIYVWGVTHWGTSWDYVLTDIKIEEDA